MGGMAMSFSGVFTFSKKFADVRKYSVGELVLLISVSIAASPLEEAVWLLDRSYVGVWEYIQRIK